MKTAHDCPFCKSTNLGIINVFDESFNVGCKDCGMTGPQAASIDEAIDIWNRLCSKMCSHCITRPFGKAVIARSKKI